MNARKGLVIQLEKVHFSYENVNLLRDVNLAVQRGEMMGIIGPNGGGKTTLLKLILGLLKPDTGSIRVFGRPPEEATDRIGYVPQNHQVDPLFPVNALEVVTMGRINASHRWFHNKDDHEAAMEALNRVGLVDRARSSFTSLSGGQKQRALIARALAASPDLLLFDEPTAHIDTFAGKRIYDLLQELNQRMTVLIVSHDIGFVSSHVNRVACVNGTVAVHPTSNLSGHTMEELYGLPLALIRHDHENGGEPCCHF